MKIERGFEGIRGGRVRRVVAVGIFDGVHKGHVKILKGAVREARSRGMRAMAVTFEPHPVKVLQPGRPHPILMSLEHRLRLFSALGLHEALVIPFTKRTAGIPHSVFLEEILIERLGMRSLWAGHDFRFGRFGAGDGAYLRGESKRKKFGLHLIPAVRSRGRIISSTRIRSLIASGRLDEASRMLGRPVSIYGDIVRGHGRGKRLGFPTANLNPHHETLPPAGVYAVKGVLDGRTLKGVVHIGQRPTFSEKDASVEAHFIGFHGDLYGREAELIFVRKLRPIRRFSGPQALKDAIQKDIAAARAVLR